MDKNTKYDPAPFWDKRYELFDITTSGHIDLPYKFNQWMYKLKLRKIRHAAERFIGKSNISKASVIDLGCGTGVYVKQWQSLNVENLTGVDISNTAVKNLQKQYPGYAFYCDNLSNNESSSFSDGNVYDIVTAIGVLVHIIDDNDFKKALENISKLVKPEGVILLTEYLCRDGTQESSYMKVRNLSWYKDALNEAGLELVEQSPLYFLMGRPYDTPSTLARILLPPVFKLTRRLIQRSPQFMGCSLYLIDLLVTGLLTDGPSEELLVCRKQKLS